MHDLRRIQAGGTSLGEETLEADDDESEENG